MNFLAAPLAASALWASFLAMLIADSFVLGDHRPRLRADGIDRGSLPTGSIDVRDGCRLSTAWPATEERNPAAPGRGRLRVHGCAGLLAVFEPLVAVPVQKRGFASGLGEVVSGVTAAARG